MAMCTAGVAAEPAASVLLMPRSLVAFAGEAYSHHLHGIDQVRHQTSASCSGCGAPSLLSECMRRVSRGFCEVSCCTKRELGRAEMLLAGYNKSLAMASFLQKFYLSLACVG